MVKRLLDIMVALILLVITGPVLFLVLLIIWWKLRCNVIFAESRVGKNGRLFKMYKVTSMKPTPENIAMRAQGPITKNDPRIIPFARFIRRYSLDELPQFINVIKGDMSLIGPRPELPKSVKHWSEVLPDYPKRLSVLPGMTGLAQIKGYRKSYIEPAKRLECDLYYITQISLWLDVTIVWHTPQAILFTEVW